MDKLVLSVFEFNSYVAGRLYQDGFLSEIWVEGEVTGFNVRHGVGYFALSDGQASVDCVFFDCEESAYAELLTEGASVLIKGEASIYRKNGRFRIAVERVELTGMGELYASLNFLKERLEKRGIFSAEHKKSIPAYPGKIGIVTSKEGAAIHDIVNIAGRRNPLIAMALYPVRVQGEGAPADIVRGIEYFNENKGADVLIVGRGGGSAEDLMAFNDERVVMAIFDSRIPVISAVGHESDYTLADLAADLRASTPSAAAELAVPVRDEISLKIRALKDEMRSRTAAMISDAKSRLNYIRSGVQLSAILLKLEKASGTIEDLRRGQYDCVQSLFNKTAVRLKEITAGIENMNPQKVFERGYSVTLKGGAIVKSAAELSEGDALEIVFRDGGATARVTGVEAD